MTGDNLSLTRLLEEIYIATGGRSVVAEDEPGMYLWTCRVGVYETDGMPECVTVGNGPLDAALRMRRRLGITRSDSNETYYGDC